MIWNKYVFFCILIFMINNILIWYQLNAQLVWDSAKTWKGITISLLMGIPITALFWYATKIGYIGFGNLWGFWKSPKGIALSLLLGIPITAGFWLCTKWGYIGFGNLWSVRFMGFATSMMTFPLLTWLYLGEVITLKTGITIVLAFIIMLLQLI